MKKTFYIVSIVILFVFLIVFYGQNVASVTTDMTFLWMTKTFSSGYFIILTMGMLLGILIILLIQTIIKDVRNQEPEKLSL